jgi:hypothetical protein
VSARFVAARQLRQQLVQRLLPLVVPHAAHFPVAPPLGHGVDLVDEDDGRGLLARAGEHVAHASRAHAHVQLHELRGAHADERHASLTRDGARE